MIGLLGLPSRLAPADLDEEALLLAEPLLAAMNVALAKARATATRMDELVLAADTLVVLDGEILGKPRSADAASSTLERLRARGHSVMTGVVVRRGETEWSAVVTTRVMMRAYSPEEVSAYIARGEPFDKAGGYAVQDETFRPVERLEGCYLNVVGLPLCAVAAGLNAMGIPATSAGSAPCAYCERGKELVRSG